MSDNYFPTLFQYYIHLSRYSRWLPEKKRRETMGETVDRYFNFFEEHLKENTDTQYSLPKELRSELQNAVIALEVMPSMRALMTAEKPSNEIQLLDITVHMLQSIHPEPLMKSYTSS